MFNNLYLQAAFAETLQKTAKAGTHKEAFTLLNSSLTKEALLGVNALIKGMKGVYKGTKGGFIKAKVGRQVGKPGVTSRQLSANKPKIDRAGRITYSQGGTPAQIAELKGAEKLIRSGKKMRKGTWQNMKTEFKTDVQLAKGKFKRTSATTSKATSKPASTKPNSANTIFNKAKNKAKKLTKPQLLAGGAGVAGIGGYAAGTDEKTVTVVHKSASINGAVLAALVKKSNINPGGKTQKNIQSTTKVPPTIKQQPLPNAMAATPSPSKRPKFAEFEKASNIIMRHAGRLSGSIGKAVGTAVKGGVRANAKASKLTRGNLGKTLLKKKKLTGAATVGAGAVGANAVFGD